MRGAALEDQVEHSRDPFAEGSAAPDRQDGPRTTLQDALRALASAQRESRSWPATPA